MEFSLEALIILFITIVIIITNILILLIIQKTEVFPFVNRYFFTSLTVADLLIGIVVTPFSFWAAIFDKWIYGETFCHLQAYISTILWIASVYSLMWVSIDHYVAIRKPDRHESIMTAMRCRCWVAFVWLAALCFCCPPLLGEYSQSND